jgi:hypothetical protein
MANVTDPTAPSQPVNPLQQKIQNAFNRTRQEKANPINKKSTASTPLGSKPLPPSRSSAPQPVRRVNPARQAPTTPSKSISKGIFKPIADSGLKPMSMAKVVSSTAKSMGTRGPAAPKTVKNGTI